MRRVGILEVLLVGDVEGGGGEVGYCLSAIFLSACGLT